MAAGFQRSYPSRRCATPKTSIIGYLLIGTDNTARKHAEEALLKAGALQRAIFQQRQFLKHRHRRKGVIQIFMSAPSACSATPAAEVINKITPADISDSQEVIARAKALSAELGTSITPASKPWCSRLRAGSRTSTS